jgi:hypothetical protein
MGEGRVCEAFGHTQRLFPHWICSRRAAPGCCHKSSSKGDVVSSTHDVEASVYSRKRMKNLGA